jgi:formylglycine-generating enzyme required for sulfatase activity
VETVSWNDAQEFIQRLNAKTGKQYRLPTEAEWEYACYGDNKTDYCGSNDIDALAWYKDNSGGTTHPVGQKQANAYGLYDMSGNVSQLLQDKYDSLDTYRIFRGGSWAVNASLVSNSWLAHMSSKDRPTDRSIAIGFRLARTLP